MNKKFIVRLSDEERGICQEIIKKLKGSSQKVHRAQILLKADADGQAASGLRTLDLATARGRTGNLGSGGLDQSRDSPQDAKKNGMTKRKIEYWVIPPEQDGEFVACMEEVLETYAEAYDPQHPVLCMDEQPVQLLKETRVPIEATREHGKRVDYEYERNGTASIF